MVKIIDEETIFRVNSNIEEQVFEEEDIRVVVLSLIHISEPTRPY